MSDVKALQRDGNGGVHISGGALKVIVTLLVLAIGSVGTAAVTQDRARRNAASIEKMQEDIVKIKLAVTRIEERQRVRDGSEQ